ncbi:hypothetical protein BGZ79_003618, partial [Entomortierella chlamydospora]
MLARTYIAYVAVAVIALVSMTNAAPAEAAVPDFLNVPREDFPACCQAEIAACCHKM